MTPSSFSIPLPAGSSPSISSGRTKSGPTVAPLSNPQAAGRPESPLEAPRFGIKFFAAEPFPPGPRAVVPVFHEWIQTHRLEDELLIDVADYSHVHHGPGVLLISHEAQYSLDQAGGRLRLPYSPPREGQGAVQARP